MELIVLKCCRYRQMHQEWFENIDELTATVLEIRRQTGLLCIIMYFQNKIMFFVILGFLLCFFCWKVLVFSMSQSLRNFIRWSCRLSLRCCWNVKWAAWVLSNFSPDCRALILIPNQAVSCSGLSSYSLSNQRASYFISVWARNQFW